LRKPNVPPEALPISFTDDQRFVDETSESVLISVGLSVIVDEAVKVDRIMSTKRFMLMPF
jgi:hypothetical protein